MRLPDYAQVQRWHRLPAMLATNPQLLTANGRPRRAGLSVRNYNENNHDLEVEIGVESPIVRKSGSKRRRQL